MDGNVKRSSLPFVKCSDKCILDAIYYIFFPQKYTSRGIL